MTLLAYLPLKLLVYIWWCYRGIFYLKLDYPRPMLKAIIFGFIRFLLGLMFAVVILLLTMMIYNSRNPFITGLIAYIIVYPPIHWLEWSILEFIMNKKSRTFDFLLLGANTFSRRWRLGGVLIGVLLDLPFIILSKGASVGNFYMC